MRRRFPKLEVATTVLTIWCVSISNTPLLAVLSVGNRMNAVERTGPVPQRGIAEVKRKLLEVERLRFTSERGNRVRAHMKRLIALIDIAQLPSAASQRAALRSLGLTVGRRTVGQRVEVFVASGGRERVVQERPLSALGTLGIVARREVEVPDGATPSTRFDPTTVEECEDYADLQIAIADAGEAEWQATYDEIEAWVNENPDADCDPTAAVDVPGDGATNPAGRSDGSPCSDKAWTALTNAAGAVLGYFGMKGITAEALTTLKAAAAGAIAAYEAGAATWAATTLAVDGAITAFVGSISLGWIATGLLAAAGGYYAYEYLDCIGILEIQPVEVWLM